MFDGQSFYYGPSYEPLDLFHYSAPGVRDFSGGRPGYFSANGGTTNLNNFNTNAGGDYGDWASSVGNDAFLAFSSPGVVNGISANDLTEMNLLGWDPKTATAPVVTIALADDTSGGKAITSNDALTGTADANATVTLSEGATLLGATTSNASGVWSFTPSGLAQGGQTVTASETNAAGLTGSATLAFTYDTVSPTVTIALAHDTSGGKDISSNDALTGAADANAAVIISEGSAVLGTTTANTNGVWSFTPTALAQGLQAVTASDTNTAGLTGTAALSFTFDTVAPNAPIVTSDVVNNDSSVTLTGTAEVNARVTVYDGQTLLGMTLADTSGAWNFTTKPLANGAQSFTATATDIAGNTSAASSAVDLFIGPAAPSIVSFSPDTGVVGDGITSATTITLTGDAAANSTVAVFDGSNALGTASADGSGAWKLTASNLTNGAHSFSATDTVNGVTSGASAPFIVTVDNIPPTVTIALAQDTGVSSADNVTANPALTGTADPNAVVTLSEGSSLLGTTIANASGVWSFSPAGLAQGTQTIVASEINVAGVAGTAALSFIFDTIAPTVIFESISGSTIRGATGTLIAGQTVQLTLALTEAVVVTGGTPALTLNDGGTATYDAAHSTSTSLAFDYSVANGQYTNALAVTGINLNGASVTDIAGNAANFAGANSTFANLAVDGTQPVATADHAHDLLNGSVSVAAPSGVLANDSDANPADVLSVSAVNGSSANVGQSVNGTYGVLTMQANGAYTYSNTNAGAVTALGGVTEDTFTYAMSNGHSGIANSVLNVLITSPTETYLTGASGGSIRAGSGSDVLDGSAGNMTLTAGQNGTQWLVGGAGDTLNASTRSADTFLFPPNFGQETINNFNANLDVIDLPHSEFPNFAAVQADLHASGTSTVITLDATDSITLTHLSVQSLHSQNFHFF